VLAPLSMAPEGSLVKVKEVRAGAGLARRLAERGILHGATLRVVKSGPGPVIVELLGPLGSPGPRLILGLGMAFKILVEVR